jgi:hypothetical protein
MVSIYESRRCRIANMGSAVANAHHTGKRSLVGGGEASSQRACVYPVYDVSRASELSMWIENR